MKNIHILPTDKPIKNVGDLVKDKYGDIHIFTKNDGKEYGKTTTKINIYVTNDEEIKEGVDQWYLDKYLNKPRNSSGAQYGEKQNVIILTTDPQLIKDGVQAIDDEFLEWFVKNPSCEEVDFWKYMSGEYSTMTKEEPKQETLEEFAERLCDIPKILSGDKYKWSAQDRVLYNFILEGAEWMQERSYSEEEVLVLLHKRDKHNIDNPNTFKGWKTPKEWFKQFKKK
jgi:hypothetical protein